MISINFERPLGGHPEVHILDNVGLFTRSFIESCVLIVERGVGEIKIPLSNEKIDIRKDWDKGIREVYLFVNILFGFRRSLSRGLRIDDLGWSEQEIAELCQKVDKAIYTYAAILHAADKWFLKAVLDSGDKDHRWWYAHSFFREMSKEELQSFVPPEVERYYYGRIVPRSTGDTE